ncbi:MAG TPA: cation diffusion facilitator family transporter [Hyphomicrobiaceae bacterium]|nr:cation diffusion facilitator family transporter [Hyphomicrobiaceae bacterium]
MIDIKEKAALTSVFASGGLAIAKFVAAITSGSLGLLSDALHSLLDLGATILTYIAVRIGGRPADDTHHYGHGKVEAVAALIETGLLFAVAVYVVVEAVGRLQTGPAEVESGWLVYGVLLVSIVVDYVRSRALRAVARETGSDALAADAVHFESDLVSSALVLIGLVATQYGFGHGDTLAAFGVAIFIAIAGWRLGRRTIDTLMDAVPAGFADRVRASIEDVRGVARVTQLRLRPSGPDFNAAVEVGVSRTLPLHRVTEIKEQVTAAVRELVGKSGRVLVSTHPEVLDDETIMERVLHVASVLRRPVHHITVQHIGDRLAVSLDLEIDGRMSLAEGHRIADELENALAEELGPDVEIETHIEPLEVSGLTGRDVEETKRVEIEAALHKRAAETGIVSDIHDVRARMTEHGIVVNYHCHVDPALPIAVMHHHVDTIEQAIRRDIAGIERAIGHAEPA